MITLYGVPVLAFCALVLLDAVRASHLAPPAWVTPALLVAAHASGWLTGRHPVGLLEDDLLLLRTPERARAVLLWPLLRAAASRVAVGAALALLLTVTTPLGAGVWGLPVAGASSVLLVSRFREAERAGDRAWPVILAGLPLLGLLHAALLPAAVLVAFVAGARGWWRGALDTPGPRAVQDMHHSGLCARASALRLPAPARPAGRRRARPRPAFTPPVPGAASALLWRAARHLHAHGWRAGRSALPGWRALPALALGAALPLLTLQLPGGAHLVLPLLPAGLLLSLLAAVPPAPPATLPVPPATARAARLAPAALLLGPLSAAGAFAATLILGLPAAATVTAALLLPGAALTLTGWTDPAPHATRGSALLARLALCTAPVLIVWAALAAHAAWAAPLLLLALSAPDTSGWRDLWNHARTARRGTAETGGTGA
ncbi:hypothetical protein GCM10008939_15150 [Deinococcus aquiradiocola]|uniref:Uncharacterized protein n=1 Tax=Deinococcus aquiradiocola TaxID=393059 RepID=A0A917PDL6_9DEIO|nr:hypothetical protein GCM10008939_15150 [Deinococcus aquiradiocola]